MARKENPPELEQMAEMVGTFIHYWGFKKVHGKIWVHLYTSAQPLDSASLQERLGISKALVSMALAELKRFKVIEEAGQGPHGTQLYTANSKLWEVIAGVLREREQAMMSLARAGCENLERLPRSEKEKFDLCPDRLRSLKELCDFSNRALQRLLQLKSIDAVFLKRFI